MSRASWSKLGGGRLRRELELARELGWDWGRATGFRPQEKGRGVLLDCAWTRKPDCEEARLLAGLPDVLLPERSEKCWGCVASFMPLADRTSCTAASSLPCWGRKSVFSRTHPVPRTSP